MGPSCSSKSDAGIKKKANNSFGQIPRIKLVLSITGRAFTLSFDQMAELLAGIAQQILHAFESLFHFGAAPFDLKDKREPLALSAHVQIAGDWNSKPSQNT